MVGYKLTPNQRAVEAEAEFRDCLILQPVVEAQDPIGNAIRDFVHGERKKSFAFLGQNSHTNSDEQVFGTEIGNIAAIDEVCRCRRYNLSKSLGDPITTDVRRYTFRPKSFDLAKTMPVQLLGASAAASPTVPTTEVISVGDSTSVEGEEHEEMLDVITTGKSEGNALVPASSKLTVPSTTVLCKSGLDPQASTSNRVEGQEDNEIADVSDIIAGGEGSSHHVSIEEIQVLDWINDGSWVGAHDWMRKEFNYDSDAYDWRVPQNQLGEQIAWWKNNNPKHADARCPWSSWTAGGHSCQNVWIDWFLVHVFDKLRHHQGPITKRGLEITLSGCIKTSTRTKWENIFLNERRRHTDYNNRHRIEETKRIHARFEPIPSRCRMSCVSTSDPRSRFNEDDRRAIRGLEDEICEAYWSFRD